MNRRRVTEATERVTRRWQQADDAPRLLSQVPELDSLRMQIEEMVRDRKQHLGLERMRATTLRRRGMWLVLAAIAYSYLYWLGRVAQQAGLAERYHNWKTESHFWLGLQLFRHNDPDLTTLLARWLNVPRQSG